MEEAARNFENDENALNSKWLQQLMQPGSSLGGARPKATVIDTQGQLWIAKFPSKHDKNDTGAWEIILTSKGWVLSPLYDVNPVPYGNELALLVDDRDNSISKELAVRTAPYFGITQKDAQNLVEDILFIVRNNWENLAREHGLTRSQMEDMRPAFSLGH